MRNAFRLFLQEYNLPRATVPTSAPEQVAELIAKRGDDTPADGTGGEAESLYEVRRLLRRYRYCAAVCAPCLRASCFMLRFEHICMHHHAFHQLPFRDCKLHSHPRNIVVM